MKTCLKCQQKFEGHPAQWYCGDPCRSPTARSPKKQGSCRTCGASTPDARFLYCSNACRPAKKPKPASKPREPEPRVCACGAEWTPSNPAVQTSQCPDCREAGRQRHVYTAKKGWRSAIRNRAQGHCEECGATEQQTGAYHHAHHIVPRSEGGQDTLENGKLLCVNCHDAVHGGGAVGGTLLRTQPVDLVDQIAERVVQLLKEESLV